MRDFNPPLSGALTSRRELSRPTFEPPPPCHETPCGPRLFLSVADTQEAEPSMQGIDYVIPFTAMRCPDGIFGVTFQLGFGTLRMRLVEGIV